MVKANQLALPWLSDKKSSECNPSFHTYFSIVKSQQHTQDFLPPGVAPSPTDTNWSTEAHHRGAALAGWSNLDTSTSSWGSRPKADGDGRPQTPQLHVLPACLQLLDDMEKLMVVELWAVGERGYPSMHHMRSYIQLFTEYWPYIRHSHLQYQSHCYCLYIH